MDKFDHNLLDTKYNPNDDRSRNMARFYEAEVESEYRKDKDGAPAKSKVVHIEIRIPGNKDIVNRVALPEDKMIYPQAWQAFEDAKEGDAGHQGTPVEQMEGLPVNLMHHLKANSIYTVEQLAHLSDTQVQNLGMGMNDWRQKAQNKLRRNKEQEFEDMKAAVAALQTKPDVKGKGGAA